MQAQIKLDYYDRQLIQFLQKGLPLSPHPYREIANKLNMSEQAILAKLKKFFHQGLINRFGVIVRHKELGYHANGMVVWNIEDQKVKQIARCLAGYEFVTLCYRRPRRPPHWQYNLFTMVHGSSRQEVRQRVAQIVSECALEHIDHDILFSTRRFKQRGARYISARPLLRRIK